ncbi:MAG: short chain dehydrogenase [Solirubrobacterales bacterium 70-9]|nr:MAG: short chain dehydrogenase [Solirubrobacterales bacterium 70-9]
MSSLEDRTVFMSGGSREIGLAIAKRLAGDGANVAFIAKTDKPHPTLPGTIHTAAAEIEAAGGEALPILGDIRDADAVEEAVARTVERFGGIDICVNNASALNLAPMRDLPVKRFDLLQQINARGTYVVTRACLPHLRQSDHAHVLSLSPPFSDDTRWLAGNAAYTLSKYGMTMITLGIAADEPGIAANCLWPRTAIRTAAVQNLLGGEASIARSRTPEIVADAAHAILAAPPSAHTGQALIDDEVLVEAGVTDLSRYHPDGEIGDLLPDFFITEVPDAQGV